MSLIYSMQLSLTIVYIEHVNRAKNNIDFTVQKIPVYQRPRCLIITYDLSIINVHLGVQNSAVIIINLIRASISKF